MKTIRIEKGKEFQIYTHSVLNIEEDVFYEQYQKAYAVVEALTAMYKGVPSDEEIEGKDSIFEEWEYSNNVIVFSGERGQGKSSAMFQFTRHYFPENSSALVMRTIDPSALEAAHGMVDIIVSRLLDVFRQQDNGELNQDRQRDLMKRFLSVHKNMTVLKNSQKYIEREYDYSGTVMQLQEVSGSLGLKQELQGLILDMLKLTGKKYLVIPMDDLDLNIRSVYDIMEQLRKYLILPRVILVMALNMDQMQLCFENFFSEELRSMQKSRWDLGKEARRMAEKYLEKLIPYSRRIYLPDVHAFAQNGRDVVHIQAVDGEEVTFDSKKLGIERGMLRQIYWRTGLIFIPQENRIHPIIPRTLRELVSLISMISSIKMLKGQNEWEGLQDRLDNLEIFEQYFKQVWIGQNLSEKEQEIIEAILNTNPLSMHKTAFYQLYDYLSDYVRWPQKFGYSYIPGNGDFSQSIVWKAEEMLQTDEKVTNGDLQNLLWLLGHCQLGNTENLRFAVSCCFSLQMQKMYAEDKLEASLENRKAEGRFLSAFVGGRIWGEYALIPQILPVGLSDNASEKKSRIGFSFSVYDFLNTAVAESSLKNQDWKKLLDPYEAERNGYLPIQQIRTLMKENDDDAEQISKLFYMVALFSNISLPTEYGQSKGHIVGGNSKLIEHTRFRLDNVFCGMICPEITAEAAGRDEMGLVPEAFDELTNRIGLKRDFVMEIVTNIELTADLAVYAVNHRETKSLGESPYLKFFQNLDRRMRDILLSLHILPSKDRKNDYKILASALNTLGKKKSEGKSSMVGNDVLMIPIDPVRPTFSRKDCTYKTFLKKLIQFEEYVKNRKISGSEDIVTQLAGIYESASAGMENYGENALIGETLCTKYNELYKRLPEE